MGYKRFENKTVRRKMVVIYIISVLVLSLIIGVFYNTVIIDRNEKAPEKIVHEQEEEPDPDFPTPIIIDNNTPAQAGSLKWALQTSMDWI